MKIPLMDAVTIMLALCAAVASFAVNQTDVANLTRRMEKVEAGDNSTDFAVLKVQVAHLGCDIGNVKRIIRNQPERDCIR